MTSQSSQTRTYAVLSTDLSQRGAKELLRWLQREPNRNTRFARSIQQVLRRAGYDLQGNRLWW